MDRRYYFEIPGQNIFSVIHAESRKEAQHKIMQSVYAPFYRSINWLSSDDDYVAQTHCSDLPSTVAIIPTIAAAQHFFGGTKSDYDA